MYIVTFCAGFILSGMIAGWAGMWTRPAKIISRADLSRGLSSHRCIAARMFTSSMTMLPPDCDAKPSEREPAWYDFLLEYSIFRYLNIDGWRSLWQLLAWPFRNYWVFPVGGILGICAYGVGSLYVDDANGMKVAKAWCAREGCEAIECSHTNNTCVGSNKVICQLRFPGKQVEDRDCRGKECSPP